MGNILKKKKQVGQKEEIEFIQVNVVLLGSENSLKNQVMLSFNANAGVMQAKTIESVTKLITVKEDDETLRFRFKVSEPVEYKQLKSVMSTYYQDTTAIVFVYNTAERDSFDAIHEFYKDRTIFNPKNLNLPMLLVGNNGHGMQRLITEKDGKDLASKLQIPYLEVDSSTYTAIEDIFTYTAREGITRGIITRNVPESTSFTNQYE